MTNLRLLHNDVLIRSKKLEVSSTIAVVQKNERKEKLNAFEVISVSPNVTLVKPGDTILVNYGEHTIPMLWNGETCAITSENSIAAVLEN
jgi:co-chaperonin GroES (HSP10)